MKPVQRLLLVPCLAPLLALLLIATSASRSPSRLQLLVWSSNPQPIGAWMALAGLGGAALSGVAALLLLPPAPRLSRRYHQSVAPDRDGADWSPGPSRAAEPMPERDVRDPAPTVAVPYRVVHRGSGASDASSHPPQSAPAGRSRPTAASAVDAPPDAVPSVGSMDWGDDPDRDW